MLDYKKSSVFWTITILFWSLRGSFAQSGCECGLMAVPVFSEDFSSGELTEKVWDLDLQTHSRTWTNTPEQQYYVNAWHTWLDPEDLIDFSYSSEAGSDVLTMKI